MTKFVAVFCVSVAALFATQNASAEPSVARASGAEIASELYQEYLQNFRNREESEEELEKLSELTSDPNIDQRRQEALDYFKENTSPEVLAFLDQIGKVIRDTYDAGKSGKMDTSAKSAPGKALQSAWNTIAAVAMDRPTIPGPEDFDGKNKGKLNNKAKNIPGYSKADLLDKFASEAADSDIEEVQKAADLADSTATGLRAMSTVAAGLAIRSSRNVGKLISDTENLVKDHQ
jgi:hypothetical protein